MIRSFACDDTARLWRAARRCNDARDGVGDPLDVALLAAADAAGLDRADAEAAVRFTLTRVGPGSLAELSLDRLDLWFIGGSSFSTETLIANPDATKKDGFLKWAEL